MNDLEVKYISLNEAAKLTNYSQDYISLLCRQKKMKGTKIGRNWVTTKEWVENYINRTKGNGQNIIPVKIKSAEHRELGSQASELSSLSSLAENTRIGDSALPAIGKLILATIICSLFVSGFIFLRLGFQKKAIEKTPSQIAREASVNIAEGIISISDSLDVVKNKAAKFAVMTETQLSAGSSAYIADEIIGVSNSLNVIKNESAKFAADRVIALNDSLNLIKNESTKFASDKIIALDNSLGVVGNRVNKKSANEMAEVSESQNDSDSSVLTSADSITDENSLSSPASKIFDGGSAGNRTPETLMSKQSPNHSGPAANLLYQINLEKSKLAREIIFLSGSLDIIKNISAESAADKIIVLNNSLNTIKNETAKFANYKIAVTGNSLNLIKSESVKFVDSKAANISGFASGLRSPAGTMEPTIKFAAGGIIAFSGSLENVNDGGKELLAEAKNNLSESFGRHSERIKNNLENFTQPLRTKLARLSRSKDIIFASVSGGTNINKSRQGRVAGVSAEKFSDRLEEPPQPLLSGGLSGVLSQKIISLSDSLDIIKNKPAEFTAGEVIAFGNSLNTIKNESTKFAMNEVDRLYYSLDFIKNKSEEKVRIALNKFGIGEKSPLVAENPEEAKSKESIDKLEREIIGDIQKRFDEFSGEQAYLSPAKNQNYGAAIVPYSDLEDKKKKIENLKESFSDEVSIEEDENSETGTITPNIPGENQRYLYLMVPMK